MHFSIPTLRSWGQLVEDTIVSTISNASGVREKWICSICKAIFGLEYEFFDADDIRKHDKMVHPRQAPVEVVGESA